MDIDNKSAGAYSSEASALHRPKPFVTILDGAALASKPIRRKASIRQTSVVRHSVRKSGTKLRSYAGETLQASSKNIALWMRRSLAGLLSLPTSLIKNLKAKKNPRPDAPDPQPQTAESKQAINPAIAVKKFAAFIAGIPLDKARRILPVVLVSCIVISAGAAALIGAAQFPLSPSSLILPDEESAQALLMAYIAPESAEKENLPSGSLPPVPVTIKLGSYTVRSGDSLDKIAKRFGLRQDTLISVNNLQSASSIRAGINLRIPNMDGVSHKVRRGESLSSLSKTFGIDMTKIVDANDLASSTIAVGQSLFIPNARLSSATLRQFYGEQFTWPVRGRISSPYGYRANPFTGLRTFHSAVDIVVSVGTPIKATSDGKVADTGYNSVFGNYIILKHDSGYQSLYAHLSRINVKEGGYISRGTAIGLSGNTGQSTGPHLHFSLFKNGQALDPTKYLK